VEVLTWWDTVLTALEGDQMDARSWVDWVAKLSVLEGYRERDSLGWGDPRLRAIDIQWSDVRSDRGLAHRLAATGRVEVLVPEAEAAAAMDAAPEDTRAWFRGACLRKFPESVVAASWDSLIVEVPGERSLQRIPLLEPLRGTKDAVGDLVDGASDIRSLLESLAVADRAAD
jgi:proteasome accessory factor A